MTSDFLDDDSRIVAVSGQVVSEAVVVEVAEPSESSTQSLIERAERFQVVTRQDYEGAITFLRELKRGRAWWKEQWEDVIKKAHEAHKAALGRFQRLDKPMEDAEKALKDRCEAWADARRTAARAAISAPVIDAGAAASAAEASGDTAKAARILSEAGMPAALQRTQAPPPVDDGVPKLEGVSLLTPYTYDVVDESLVPRAYLMLDRKKIKTVVTALKQHCDIPGIRVRPDTSIRLTDK